MSFDPVTAESVRRTWQAILQRRHGGIVEVSIVKNERPGDPPAITPGGKLDQLGDRDKPQTGRLDRAA